MERNGQKGSSRAGKRARALLRDLAQTFGILPRKEESGATVYFAVGAILSAFDCFAMIMSLILS
jgi:hypothetical protein